jgi:two-component system, OmpR family, response regulator
MKEKIILLVDADADCGGAVLEAASRIAHGVRLSRDGPEAFRFLNREFDRIDSLIIDVDSSRQGLALLAAISRLHRRPPILVLTALEESHFEPVAARLGAAGCLGKPFSIDRLQAAIKHLTGAANDESVSSDPWGHPHNEEEEEVENGART